MIKPELGFPVTHHDLVSHPFEHPYLEEPFAHELVKYLRLDAHPERQWRIWTSWNRRGAPFVIDFTIHHQNRVFAYECDGEIHDELRDAARDALILNSGKVSELCRIRQGIIHRRDDVMYLLSVMNPSLYRDAGRADLQHLASRYAGAAACDEHTHVVKVWYPAPEADPDLYEDYDQEKWEEGSASFHDPANPLASYIGERLLGVHIIRRFRGYDIFSDARRSRL